jgi:hypothetical protein
VFARILLSAAILLSARILLQTRVLLQAGILRSGWRHARPRAGRRRRPRR